MRFKRLVLLISIVCLMIPFVSGAKSSGDYVNYGDTFIFVDVPNDYWAKDQINYFAKQGIVDGYEDGTFNPEGGVTREEFCKLLVSTFNQPLETPNSPTFADVPKDRWSYPYVEVCRDFLTGYFNPFGGLSSFHPEEYATREDIAVALVRMMGFTDEDVKDKNYALKKFSDGNTISPNLLSYVSLACERGLISGYPEGTFAPLNGITRAETVVLLNRATKQAVTNINSELDISASVIYSNDGKTATIKVVSESGSTVTVNGEKIKMTSNYSGKSEGSYVYNFSQKDSKSFVVTGVKAGKEKSVYVTALYNPTGPVITLLNCPETTEKGTVNLIGMLSDSKCTAREIILIINGEKVYVSYDGSWEKKLELEPGENKVTISATNTLAHTTLETRKIEFKVDGPVLTIDDYPKSVDDDRIKISGKVTDKKEDDSYYSRKLKVTVNGKETFVSYDGEWDEYVDLNHGENEIVIVATNKYNVTTTKKIKISYEKPGPKLTITKCPSTTNELSVEIAGEVEAADYSYWSKNLPGVTVNNKSVSVNYSGEWKTTVTLTPGNNDIKVVATGQDGGKTTINRTIKCNIKKPEIKVYNCPESTDKSTVTLQGSVDFDDSAVDYVKLSVSGNNVYVDSNGNWKTDIKLKKGRNNIEIIVTDSNNQSSTIKKTIVYEEDDYYKESESTNKENVKVEETEKNTKVEVEELDDLYFE